MSNVVVMVGAGIISLILFLLFMKAGDKERPHQALQVLLLGFILVCFVLIGKAALDDSDKACAYLVNSSNTQNNITSYTYTYNCQPLTTNTGQFFFKFTVTIMGIVGIYLLCYLIYAVLVYFGWVVPHNKEGKGNEGGGVL